MDYNPPVEQFNCQNDEFYPTPQHPPPPVYPGGGKRPPAYGNSGSYSQRPGGQYYRSGGYQSPNTSNAGNTYTSRSYQGNNTHAYANRAYGAQHAQSNSTVQYGQTTPREYVSHSARASLHGGSSNFVAPQTSNSYRNYSRPVYPNQQQAPSSIPMPIGMSASPSVQPQQQPYRKKGVVQNVGFMAPPKRYRTAEVENNNIDELLNLMDDEPDAMPPPQCPPPVLRNVPPNINYTPQPSPLPYDRPSQSAVVAVVPSEPLMDGALSSVLRCAAQREEVEQTPLDRLEGLRRRNFQVTWYCTDTAKMKEVIGRMSTITAERGSRNLIVVYAIFQREICSSPPFREHWQMYLEFERPMSVAWVKRDLFQDNSVHVTMRLQSRDVCREYCAKARTRKPGPSSEVGPFEFGTWRLQGKASEKMAEIQQAIVDGRNLVDIAEDDGQFATVVKNHRNLEWFEEQFKMRQAMKDIREVTVRLFYGPTGTGKTHLAIEEAIKYCKGRREDVFILDTSGQSKQMGVKLWFDGYKYGPVLIIDEYNGWIDTEFLLRLLDKNPVRLQVKFGTKWAFWREVWITSNIPLNEWTECGRRIDDRHREAIERRVDWIVFIPERGRYVIEKQPHDPVDLDFPTVEPFVLHPEEEQGTGGSVAPESLYTAPTAEDLYTMALQYGSQTPNDDGTTTQDENEIKRARRAFEDEESMPESLWSQPPQRQEQDSSTGTADVAIPPLPEKEVSEKVI